jgi:hypothetical protein
MLGRMEKLMPVFSGGRPKPHAPRVAIADDFRTRSYFLGDIVALGGNKQKSLTSHGDIAEGHARLIEPDGTILRFQVGSGCELLPALRRLSRYMAKRPVDAVSLSIGSYLTLHSLKRELGLPAFTLQDIPDNRERIMGLLGPELRESIALLENLAKTVPVFVSIGNEGRHYFNVYLLARGVIAVGSQKPDGSLWEYNGCSPYQRIYEETFHVPVPVQERDGRLNGFSLLHPEEPIRPDTRVHIPSDRVSLQDATQPESRPGGSDRLLIETSYAAPQAAMKEALKRVSS